MPKPFWLNLLLLDMCMYVYFVELLRSAQLSLNSRLHGGTVWNTQDTRGPTLYKEMGPVTGRVAAEEVPTPYTGKSWEFDGPAIWRNTRGHEHAVVELRAHNRTGHGLIVHKRRSLKTEASYTFQDAVFQHRS
jgi:hypothetical protein